MIPWLTWKNYFPMPDPNQNGFMWNAAILEIEWTSYVMKMVLITLIVYWIFYFKTKPNENGVKRFLFFTAFLGIVSMVLAWWSLTDISHMLFIEPAPWSSIHTVITIIAGLLSEIQIIVLVLILYLGFSMIPNISWRLRAMRRYPFKHIP